MKALHLVSVGTFDGVHLGHLKLLGWLKSAARRRKLKTMAVLFEKPPKSFFMHGSVPLLTTIEERKRLLKAVGIDVIKPLRFNARLAAMSHSRFFSEFLLRRCRAGGVVVGPDFAYGHGRRGSVHTLRVACRRAGIYFSVPPLVREDKAKVSSTRIRELLLHSRVLEAARLLGRPYSVSGRVVRGRELGAKIGVPTANLEIAPGKLVPRGVFAVGVWGGPFRSARAAVCNVGTRPTIDASGRSLSVEVHVPGHRGELYGRRLEVEFRRFLRPERRFSSVQALLRQIKKDVAAAVR